MIKIYHNPRCSKSRLGVQALEEHGQHFEIIKYLDNPLTFDELENIIKKLGIAPLDLIRKNDFFYHDFFNFTNMYLLFRPKNTSK